MLKLFTDTKSITRNSGIYYLKIHELNYIGSSIDIKTRLNEHKNTLVSNTHPNIRLQRCFDKYGKDECFFSILESHKSISNSDLLLLEKKWIDLLSPVANFKLDPTTQFNATSTSKKVYQYNLNGHKINSYVSVREASRQTNINTSGIIQVCNKKLKSAGGYLWSYEDKVIKAYDLQRSKWKWVNVYMLDIKTNIISEHLNIAKAAREIYKEGDNFNSICASISSVCKKKGHLVKKQYRFSLNKEDLLKPIPNRKYGVKGDTAKIVELKDGVEITVWDSVQALSKAKKISSKTIYKVLKGEKLEYQGLVYKYRDKRL